MKYRTLSAPVSVQIEVTELCDNCCRHCYNSFRHHDCPLKTLSFDEIGILVEQLASAKVLRVGITGGEPLLVWNRTKYLIERLRTKGIYVSINTNLTHFTQEIGEELLRLSVKGILTSLISADRQLHDWVTQNEGSWEKTIAGIKLAVNMGFRVSLNMVLTQWNFEHLEQTGDLAGQLGVAKFGATRACEPCSMSCDISPYVITIDQLRHSLRVLYELKERWEYKVDVFEHYPWCALQDVGNYQYLSRRSCTAGLTSATVGADGQIRPCGHAPSTYGNVLTEGLQTCWLRMEEWRNRSYPKVCQNCKYLGKCSGGCRVDAANSKEGKDRHCEGEVAVISTPVKKQGKVDTSGSFVFANEVIFREEAFGGLVGVGYGGYSLLGHETFQLLRELANSSFTIDTLISEYGVKAEEARSFLAKLLTQKIIKRRENHGT
ncbi:hypothetical protein COT52_03120 [candidate division WWE3 bacterium CG08_land_8_20_14_0_20_43_13]|uniref:Radical SAM core domain-containing protein n=2 Tax=Bacteria candidate phyla TaxID=1783234 RepID=A0A2H0X6M3_UNCKA|nr:MAG: hypothetical protein COT52_03120 [candidate division WWE3 bacterium CG08_land_8_20_14_0_20_43_13]PJE73199.1 MAG: hypothetical protein COV00_01115 [Candidatus Tagabacteria bacterium CG10_big_fil_rev_8_21_14_0_10_40_13]